MSTISSSGKIAYVYQESTDTWHPVAGSTNTAADFSWTGDHSFAAGSNVSFQEVLTAKAGVNNFLNPSARNSALGSTPSVDGIVVFVKQDADGNSINQVQYSQNGTWRNAFGQTEVKQVSSSTAYSLILSDSGKTLELSPNSGVTMTVTIPTQASAGWSIGQRVEFIRVGQGIVSFAPASGVTLNSKNGNRQIAAQWSAAVLHYSGSNSWILMGDLTASA